MCVNRSHWKIVMSEAFNLRELMNEIDGDYEFLAESLEMFEEDAPELLSRIKDGLARNDADVVWQNAHSIKSMVGNFFAQPAFDAASSIESMGRQGALSGIDKALEVLEKEIVRLFHALRQVLDDP